MTNIDDKQKFMVLNGWCPFCDGAVTVETLEKYPNTFGKTWVHKKLYIKRQKVSCSNGHSFEVIFKRKPIANGDSVNIGHEINCLHSKEKEVEK